MNKLTAVTLSLIFTANISVPAAYAQASKEEVSMCIETVKQMAGNSAPAEAIKMCEQGKMEEAIAIAMGG